MFLFIKHYTYLEINQPLTFHLQLPLCLNSDAKKVQDYECFLYLLAQFDSLKKTLRNSWMKCTNMKRESSLVVTGNQTIQDTWTRLEKTNADFFFPLWNHGLILHLL